MDRFSIHFIPICEEVPPRHGDYLVLLDNAPWHSLTHRFLPAHYTGGEYGNWISCVGGAFINVVAWAEIPDAIRKREEEPNAETAS